MLEAEVIPLNGVITDECLCGYGAKVWWQREVMLAFSRSEDRQQILQALENTMISCGTSTLYYHLEKVGPHFLQIETAEANRVIYVTVEIGKPVIFDIPTELLNSGSGPEN